MEFKANHNAFKFLNSMSENSNHPLENLIRQILPYLDKDPKRLGLQETPRHVAKSLCELTQGNQLDMIQLTQNSLLKAPSGELIILKNTEFYSLCEHHLLPFFGHIHVAYLPSEHILGLGTIAKIIDACSQKLQLQEHLTEEIANTLQAVLKPKGLIIIAKAKHFCMSMRGIKKQDTTVNTRTIRGVFTNKSELRQEVLNLLQD